MAGQVARGWQEIRRQEEMQQRLGEVVESRLPVQQVPQQTNTTDVSKSQKNTPSPRAQQKTRPSETKKKKDSAKKIHQTPQQSVSNSPPELGQILPPVADLDDGELDRL